ncbi:MAG: hypothetical protein JW850_17000 [Thermoflexales bacterium]|nr:hypothetical protein [Thermoflexales bacterium]
MPTWTIYNTLKAIASTEFPDIVVSAHVICLPTGDPLKLRLDIVDGSLLDVFLSVSGRYSYHWERRLTPQGNLYRHDNAPHGKWRRVASFPKHLHDGSEDNVVESHISDSPEEAIREFLEFVRHHLLHAL